MFDDQDLGFFANFLGIFIFLMVIAYHFVMADPKYEGLAYGFLSVYLTMKYLPSYGVLQADLIIAFMFISYRFHLGN